MNIRILDCTLRDGGFVNNWNFGHMNLINIFLRLSDAGIEIIEVGFLNDSCEFDINRSIVPRTENFSEIYDIRTNKSPMLVGMVILGECCIENIGHAKDTVLNGIRVVFKKQDIKRGIEYCKEIIKKGYKLFVQPASVTDYSDDEFIELIENLNELSPYAVYIVDTYGLMHKDNLIRYFELLDTNLARNTTVGYHAHNNFNVAYSNATEFFNMDTDRDLLIDGTVYGMGKGAGNANTELLAYSLNTYHEKNYNISQILEIINLDIRRIKDKYEWGYSIDKFISASNKCHPKYVDFLLRQNTLPISAVNEILGHVHKDKKTIYDEKLIEELYEEYLINGEKFSEDLNKLENELKDKKVLILCPGHRLLEYRQEIFEYSNAKRYSQMYYHLEKLKGKNKIITTTNVSSIENSVDFMINSEQFMFEPYVIKFNSALILIKILTFFGNTKVAVAGFDGYNSGKIHKDVYLNQHFEFDKPVEGDAINRAVIEELKKLKRKINIEFLTPSIYNEDA